VKLLRLCILLTLIIGAGLTARAAYLRAKSELASILIRRAWEHSLQSARHERPWSWADTYPIARLRIPALGYDEVVLEGATPRTLAFGPARLLSGAALGEPGNLVLAGHRTSWFEPLQSIAQGDEINLEWSDPRSGALRERTYTVTTIRVVQPQDIGLLEPTSEDALTLITCYPFGRGPHSPQRYIVRALPSGPIRPVGVPSLKQSQGITELGVPTLNNL
jgi:sortase A